MSATTDSVRTPPFDAALHPGVQAHETAYVDEPCTIGEGTKIWHFSHVMKDCRIGRNCNLGQNVVVSPDVVLGDNVKVQNNVSIYTGVELEDDVFCGPSMVFTNVINPRSEIVRRGEYARTIVRRGATLGANSTVVCGHEIGAYAFIAAGAVVAADVLPYALMAGVPARRIGWTCRCGTSLPRERAQDSKTPVLVCRACGNRYEEAESGLIPIEEPS